MINKFKKYILKHCERQAKKYQVPLTEVQLRFSIFTHKVANMTGEIAEQFKAFTSALNVEQDALMMDFVINGLSEEKRENFDIFTSSLNQEQLHELPNYMPYLLRQQEVIYVTSVNYKKRDTHSFRDVMDFTMGIDIMNLSETVPPYILNSLKTIALREGMDDNEIFVFACPFMDKYNEKNIALHLFKSGNYLKEISIEQLLIGEMAMDVDEEE